MSGSANAAETAVKGSSTVTHVGLVRGINVGANTRVSMAAFRSVFESLGYAHVVTLLQSGNVVFEAPADLGPDAVAEIERAFAAAAGFSAGFVVTTGQELLAIAEENPLLTVGDDASKLVVTFLPAAPDAAAITLPDADALLPEVVVLGSRAVYSWHPLGISNSRLPASFWKQFGLVYTGRNVKTVDKLVAMVRERNTTVDSGNSGGTGDAAADSVPGSAAVSGPA